MDDLGTDDKTIENMNLIKIWQLEVAALATCVKRFISSRVIWGSALVEMSGGFWLVLVQGELKKESYYLIPFVKNLLSSRMPWVMSFKKEN